MINIMVNNVRICSDNSPDAINALSVLDVFNPYLNIMVDANYLFGQEDETTLDNDYDLQVFLNIIPIFKDSVPKQIIAVFNDLSLYNRFLKLINSDNNPTRYLSNYGKCTIVYTPYSITEFCINRFGQALKQDLKGAVQLPYLDEYELPSDINPNDLDTILLEDSALELVDLSNIEQYIDSETLDVYHKFYAYLKTNNLSNSYLCVPQYIVFVYAQQKQLGKFIVKSGGKYFVAEINKTVKMTPILDFIKDLKDDEDIRIRGLKLKEHLLLYV